MDNFKWSSEFDVGFEQLNTEHKNIFEKMHLLDVMNTSQSTKANILFAFDSLIELTRRHFRDEELVMKEMGYPELDTHIKLHIGLITKLEKYQNEFKQSVYGSLPSSVFDFFNNWLSTHILIADKSYSKFNESK